MAIDKLIPLVGRLAWWVSGRPNRERLRGSRIEVLVLLLSRSEGTVLLAEHPYSKTRGGPLIWAPPQEGVNLNERFDDALYRCLSDECGIELPSNSGERRRRFYHRTTRLTGVVELEPSRQGSRLVADNASGTLLESVRLRRKAYWAAVVLIPNESAVQVSPNLTEITDLGWFSIEDAKRKVRETNRPEKARLIVKALAEAEVQDLGN